MNKKQEAMMLVATASDDSTTSSCSQQSPSPPRTPPPSSNSNIKNSDLDQIVPTAIVIKNIPFSIKRDALLMLLDNQNVPQPYAMNYHFDNGVFRGLAFANYRTHDLALESIQEINKISINGRQLRAEFKRMLPQAAGGNNNNNASVLVEKEENDLELSLRQLMVGSDDQNNSIAATAMITTSSNGNNNNGGGGSSSSRGRGFFSTTTRGGGGSSGWQQQDDARMMGQQQQQHKHIINGVDTNNDIESLDLSDPVVQGLIKKITQFKESDEKELVIPHLNGKRRRDAHIVAGSLGLGHFAEGIYPVRYMHVTKNPADTLKSSIYQTEQQQQQSRSGGGGGDEGDERPSSSSYREGQRRSLINLPPTSASPLSTATTSNNNNNNNSMLNTQAQQGQQQTTSSNEFASIIRPIRQPRGPEPNKNFSTRKHLAHQGRLANCVCHAPGIKI